ncbi:hypothetical protein RHMOL_Rhmol06G0234900 [Rhododendron molle]|uniref:Uncharacterized protein n=1 Tax=Rhododendron molle TaxID=49168 RepID=A0ACC0NHJ5_RHOML|nr:hypothetical protein RHMOL_Rhmol06G0234900 [Rhododendron molle]
MYGEESETKWMLKSLIERVEEEDGGVRRMIRAEVDSAWRSLGSLCKSRWDKTTQTPAGEHEYMDIIIAGTRYIIDTSPAAQYTIARPTDHYASMLQLFPQVLVCKGAELKKLVS